MIRQRFAAAAGIPAALALVACLALPAPALCAAGTGGRGQDQSLAELAKKEKERRAALKGKSKPVVTNADLAKAKRAPALTVAPVTPPVEAEVRARGEAEAGTAAAAPPPAARAAGAGQSDPDTETPVIHTVIVEPSQPAPRSSRTALEAKHAKAQEYVELLTLKMTALWQQFYAQGDPTPKDVVQQQIAETYEKLLQAQDEAVKAKADLDAAVSKSRTDVPSIWIR